MNENNTQAACFYGKYRGVVVDNNDPQQLGRLKAHVPEVLGEADSGWALPCVPYAGDGSGQYTIPEPGTGVWIEFEAGDPSRPIWSGCWWGDGQLPADNGGERGAPSRRIIRSEQGLMLTFDDSSQVITVSDQGGSNLLEIQVTAGQITLKSTTKATIEAPLIELVENADHPLVFGDGLLQYLTQVVSMFNTHLHPGQVAAGFIPVTPAPPVPALTPPTPDLLSTKVKTG
jgi:uncharacterized protein involved in type VI secretion and phage assembly